MKKHFESLMLLILFSGCINNHLGAETHYPQWVYDRDNRIDAAVNKWLEDHANDIDL